MAESTFAWLSVSVKRGATTLIARRIVKTVLLVNYFTQ